MADQTDTYDAIVVGAGPVGLLTARLLGLAGHQVLVLERWPERYPLPRAVHFDHEIGRLLQSASLTEQVLSVSERVPDHYEWRNREGESLVLIDWSQDGPCGWPVANFFSQPELERVLADSLEELGNVRLVRGLEVVQLTEGADDVTVTVTGRTLKHKQFRGRYVVGCDGANSFVRQHMTTALTDLGFYYDWLIVDVIPHEEREWSPMNWQLCDPARPTTMVSGGPGRRRWEFMRLPDEDVTDLNTAETAWRLLEPWGRTPENTTMERHAVYTFQARWADRWNQGRLLLAGDAAHLMPPFAGQGMCSGLRDAANLTWKLDQVLRGVSGGELLDTYTTERREHLQHAISMSVALGRTICVLDEEQARERDERMIAAGADPATALPAMPPERLGEGAWDAELTPEPVQGMLTPQFRARSGERAGLLDQVLHDGRRPWFTLLGYGVDPAGSLSAEQRAALDVFGVEVAMLDGGQGAGGHVTDGTHLLVAEDEYTEQWFAGAGVAVVLVRPDFYAYGGVADAHLLGRLVDQFLQELAVQPGNVPDPVPSPAR